MWIEFQSSNNEVRNKNIEGLSQTDILYKISLLRDKLDKAFIINNMITNTHIIELSRELDKAIMRYYCLLENSEALSN